jgi:predicted phosphodiesterase
MYAFVKRILPHQPSNTIVFAGDFGYDADLAISFLKQLSLFYTHVLYIYGNNDLKVYEGLEEPSKMKIERYFKANSDRYPGIIKLKKTPVYIEGLVFIGSDLFFDITYLYKKHRILRVQVENEWRRKGLDVKHRHTITDPYRFSEDEIARLYGEIKEADVIVTHGMPDYENEKGGPIYFSKLRLPQTTSELKNKTWIYGHMHERKTQVKYGCRFINASFMGEGSDQKIVTVEIRVPARKN